MQDYGKQPGIRPPEGRAQAEPAARQGVPGTNERNIVLTGPGRGGPTLTEPLENKNANPLYDRERVFRVGRRLLESEGAY